MRLQVLDPAVHFSCGSCTKCCDQPWHTLIEAEKAHALERADFSAYPQLAGKRFYRKSKTAPAGTYILAKGEGTKCIFLDTDGLCIIHKQLGPEAKPYACLKFPYMVARTPVDDRVSVDFGCPAVQDRAGVPLCEQTAEVAALIPTGKKPANPEARIALDPECTLSQVEANALIDRLIRTFDDDEARSDIWAQFAEALCLAVAVRRYKKSRAGAEDAALIDMLAGEKALPDTPDVQNITAYARPGAAPTAARLLFAATLFRDTCPPDTGLTMSLWQRLSLLPKLMSLAKLSGGYASRLLGRNVSVTEVLAHPVAPQLAPAGTALLRRYYRTRFWQRLLIGTRLSIVGGLHQHIHDLNAILFFARAQAQQHGDTQLGESHIRFGLNRVEFHLANQARLFDQANMIGWFAAQLENPTVALQSLRLMALQPAPARSAAGVPTTRPETI